MSEKYVSEIDNKWRNIAGYTVEVHLTIHANKMVEKVLGEQQRRKQRVEHTNFGAGARPAAAFNDGCATLVAISITSSSYIHTFRAMLAAARDLIKHIKLDPMLIGNAGTNR